MKIVSSGKVLTQVDNDGNHKSEAKARAELYYFLSRYELKKKDLLEKPDSQQLWIAFDSDGFYGAVVTELWQYPQIKTLIMHFTGGRKLLKWKQPMLEILQKFARDNDCEIIESYGRPGWEKVFKQDGYKKQFVFYELPVE